MHFRDSATAKCVSQINESARTGTGAVGENAGNCAFVEIHGPGVKIGCGAAGDSRQREVICALGGSAASE